MCHLHARFADSIPNTLAAKKLKIGVEVGFVIATRFGFRHSGFRDGWARHTYSLKSASGVVKKELNVSAETFVTIYRPSFVRRWSDKRKLSATNVRVGFAALAVGYTAAPAT